MSQSLAKVLVHFIFSTKHRQPLILPPVQEELEYGIDRADRRVVPDVSV